MKKIILFLCLLCSFISLKAQQAAAVDSLKTALAKATTDKERVYWLDNLSRTLMNVNPEEAEKYGRQLITLAEESRDRKLMIEAYMSNGLRCSYFAGQKDFAKKSIEHYNKALEIAKHEKMEEHTGKALLRLSTVHLTIPDKVKALNYINQAFSLISTLSNDSLQAEAHNTYGLVYQSRNEKTLALRHFLNGLRIAESINNHPLKRNCYLYLSSFYNAIEDYDKAIDYYSLSTKELDLMNEKNAPYQRAMDINALGNLYAQKKNYDIAISYFEKSIRMADSLKFATLKIPGYISLLNQYLRIDQPQKALDYLNSSSGQNLKKYLGDFGFGYNIDQAYGFIYTEAGKYDSARFHFSKALPYYEQGVTESLKISFYRQLANLYKKTGENNKAIEYYQKVKEWGEKNGALDNVQAAAKNLDTLYERKGDYKTANVYNAVYHQYKDSIEKLNKENELAQIEALDEQQRQDRLLAEKEEAKEKRNRIQYMAIVIAIAALFIGLVMMGWFKVSASTIKAIGFFAFLLFFEFIFLLFKKNIYGLTKGEPLYDLLFMIALAALLVPLHHWLEHRVIRFLTSHHMLKLRGIFSKKEGGFS